MRHYLMLLALLSLSALFSACGATYLVNIDSIRAPNSDYKSFILFPGNKDTKANDLQFREYASYVHRALIQKGLVPAKTYEDADMAIFLMYGIGDPQFHSYTYSLPTYGQTGVSSSYTTGTVNTYGNYGTYSGTTTYTPTYGVTGSTTHSGTRVSYFRYMILDAIDYAEFNKTKKQQQLWKTTVTSTGKSGDLRRVFPILVGAAKKHIGTNTGKQVRIKIREKDKRVDEVKGVIEQKDKSE